MTEINLSEKQWQKLDEIITRAFDNQLAKFQPQRKGFQSWTELTPIEHQQRLKTPQSLQARLSTVPTTPPKLSDIKTKVIPNRLKPNEPYFEM